MRAARHGAGGARSGGGGRVRAARTGAGAGVPSSSAASAIAPGVHASAIGRGRTTRSAKYTSRLPST
jgi:hypothetical protein